MDMHFTPEAKTEIQRMRDRVNNIHAAFGPDSRYFIDAADTLGAVLATMIGLGGRVAKDYDLSLICQNEFITYGVNFHSTKVTEDVPEPYRSMPGTWSVNS